MSQIEVSDREGWRRVYPLSKAIAHIGSHPQSDIVLEAQRGGGVAPRHLQLIAGPQGARVVNLGDSDVALSGERRLSPRASADLIDGDRIRVGDFNLVYYVGEAGSNLAMGGGASGDGAGRTIGLSLRLSHTELSPERPIEGAVLVQNLGNKTGAQFRLEVEGLEASAYEIGPGPILFPNAQKEVVLRLQHPRKPTPPRGAYRLTVRATAPLAYPGESATATQTIQIMPYYHHAVRLVTLE